jgi:hypothetical protein
MLIQLNLEERPSWGYGEVFVSWRPSKALPYSPTHWKEGMEILQKITNIWLNLF